MNDAMTFDIKTILRVAADAGAPYFTCNVARDDLMAAIERIVQLEKTVEETQHILGVAIRLRNTGRKQALKLRALRDQLNDICKVHS